MRAAIAGFIVNGEPDARWQRNHVNVAVTGDKTDAMLAQRIGKHFDDALTKMSRTDGMRYSASQRSSMLGAHAAKSQRANG